jgi:uncharacterized protein YjbI with pentapeptide repeats
MKRQFLTLGDHELEISLKKNNFFEDDEEDLDDEDGFDLDDAPLDEDDADDDLLSEGRRGAEKGALDKDEAKPKTLTRKEVTDILQTTRSFKHMDLRKANLSKLDCSNCDFSHCNLSYVNFKESNLESSNFSNASLWNANLEGSNLSKANLEDADLDYTKLRGAIMYKSNIRRATLPTDLIPREEILKSIQFGTKITR